MHQGSTRGPASKADKPVMARSGLMITRPGVDVGVCGLDTAPLGFAVAELGGGDSNSYSHATMS